MEDKESKIMKPIILCMGLPASGKSTTAKLLVEKLENYFIFCLPNVKEKLGLNAFNKSEEAKNLINDYLTKIKEKVQNGEGLIIDRAALRREKREDCYQLAKSLNTEIIVICHQISEGLAKKRVIGRPKEYSNPPFDDSKLVDEYLKRWSNPKEDNFNSNQHVSLIFFNTENNTIKQFRVNDKVKVFVGKIKEVLLN